MYSDNFSILQQQQQQQTPMDVSGGGGGGGDDDWRSQLSLETRQRIVNKIMETLKRHLPVSGEEGLIEIKKIAVRFEEKTLNVATSQSDYLRKISMKMLTMETKSQSQNANLMPSSYVGDGRLPQYSASQTMLSRVHNQEQFNLIPVATNQANVTDDAQKRLDAQAAEIERSKKEATESVRLDREEASGLEKIRAELAEAREHERAANDKAKVASAKVANLQVSYTNFRNGLSGLVAGNGKLDAQLLGVQTTAEALSLLLENYDSDMYDVFVSEGQQNQLLHSPKNPQEPSQSASLDSMSGIRNTDCTDWQEVYQKIKTMKDLYFQGLMEAYQKIAAKQQQHDLIPDLPKTEELEQLKLLKTMLDAWSLL